MTTDLFETKEQQANRCRDVGMMQSTRTANRMFEGWAEDAYDQLKLFCQSRCNGETFLAEDIREFAGLNGLPVPPSKRAWGSVLRRAAFDRLIERVGYQKTKNPSAHRTPATLWRVSK
jgi:hypothetical protein